MKAKLVTFTFCTRVVVPDDFTDNQIVDAATENMRQRLRMPRSEFRYNDFTMEFADNHTDTRDLASEYTPEGDQPGDFGYYEKPINQ